MLGVGRGLSAIKTSTIDGFRVKRRAEKGKKPGSLVSPYTLEKDLTALRAALNLAREWGYSPKMPKFRKVKVPEAMPRPITQEHFGAVYSSRAHLLQSQASVQTDTPVIVP